MMTTDFDRTTVKDTEVERKTELLPSKSQIKRECHQLQELGEEIYKLNNDDINSLELPRDLREAVLTAQKIKSRSGLKRQRQYIGKLLRGCDSEAIESQLRKIQHRHDTNTAQFKRLEKWRDQLIENDRQVLGEVIRRFPEIDRQHINQLVRTAQREKQQNKPPAASRKLFKYLRELEESLD
jgi:ribosome-associated protein